MKVVLWVAIYIIFVATIFLYLQTLSKGEWWGEYKIYYVGLSVLVTYPFAANLLYTVYKYFPFNTWPHNTLVSRELITGGVARLMGGLSLVGSVVLLYSPMFAYDYLMETEKRAETYQYIKESVGRLSQYEYTREVKQ